MSELILGALPILVMWVLPLAPMFYGAIAATFEALSAGSRSVEARPTTNAGTAVLRARAAVRQQTANPTGDQQAA